MNNTRRTLLKGAGSTGVLAAAAAVGILKPGQALAAEWNKAAFDSKDVAGAMKGLGAAAAAESKDLKINAPENAENGAVVPVDVTSSIPNTTSISIFVDKNPTPLSAHFEFSNGALPDVSVRLKIGNPSVVRAVAKADGKFYGAQSKEVKVAAGGCAG